MSYSRWSNSVWYTFWNAGRADETVPEDRDNAVFTVCAVADFTAKPFGTAHWLGVYNGHPAVALSYNGGATLWFYDHDISTWRVQVFSSYNVLCEKLGITKGGA